MDNAEWPDGKRYEVQLFSPVECEHFAAEDDARAFWIATPPTRRPIIRDLLTNDVIERRNA